MPTPARRMCEYPGCEGGPPDDDGVRGPYWTHEDNVRREEVIDDLKQHVKMVHELPIHTKQAATEALKAATSANLQSQQPQQTFHQKRDSIPRPTIEDTATEADWAFFVAQWKRYVHGSQMTASQELQQLWSACSTNLQRQLHNGGGQNVDNMLQLLNNIKVLVVRRRNNMVNMIEFQKMGQSANESTTQFSTRLNGKATTCDMSVKCPDCNREVSYQDHMIITQFIRGLQDKGNQERILEQAAHSETKLSLTKVLKIAECFESSKATQEQVNDGGQLSKLSQYQHNKQSSRQNSRSANKDNKKDNPKDKSSPNTCGNCGKTGHSSKLQDRREHCLAFDKTCQKCKTNGHYTNMCRGGPRQTRDKSATPKDKSTKVNEVKESNAKDKDTNDDEQPSLGSLTGSWMLLNGLSSPNPEGHIYEDSDEFSSVLHLSQFSKLNTLTEKHSLRKIRHHMQDKFGAWKPSNVQPHGKLNLKVKLSKSAATQLNLPEIQHSSPTSVSALCDTGAQMCVADWEVAKRLGLAKSDLLIPALSVSVADNWSLELMGAHFITIYADSGETSEQLVYFA